MAASILVLLGVLLAVSGSHCAHLVSFNGHRTLPQEQHDVQREASLETSVRSIADSLDGARRRRILEVFGRDVSGLQKVERGIVKGGLHGSQEHPLTRAANLVRRTVQEKLDRNRRQADLVRQVRALINDLEIRSNAQSKEAEVLGQRAVQRLDSAMTLETRAEHVRELLEEGQQKRALEKVDEIKRNADLMESTKEQVRRGMLAVQDVTEQLQRREAEKKEMRRRELLDELKHLASRSLQDKITSLHQRKLENEEKRELTRISIAQGLANSKRVLEENKLEQARELVGMKIAEGIGEAKRGLEEMRRQQVRAVLAPMAEARQFFLKRELEKEREATGMKVVSEVVKAKRALEERKLEETRDFMGMQVASELAEAKRTIDGHRLEAREMAAERFSREFEELKRAVDESKARRALNTLDTFRRSVEKREHENLLRRALDGLKERVERHASKRDEDIKELETLLAGEGVDAAEHKSARDEVGLSRHKDYLDSVLGSQDSSNYGGGYDSNGSNGWSSDYGYDY